MRSERSHSYDYLQKGDALSQSDDDGSQRLHGSIDEPVVDVLDKTDVRSQNDSELPVNRNLEQSMMVHRHTVNFDETRPEPVKE